MRPVERVPHHRLRRELHLPASRPAIAEAPRASRVARPAQWATLGAMPNFSSTVWAIVGVLLIIVLFTWLVRAY